MTLRITRSAKSFSSQLSDRISLMWIPAIANVSCNQATLTRSPSLRSRTSCLTLHNAHNLMPKNHRPLDRSEGCPRQYENPSDTRHICAPSHEPATILPSARARPAQPTDSPPHHWLALKPSPSFVQHSVSAHHKTFNMFNHRIGMVQQRPMPNSQSPLATIRCYS